MSLFDKEELELIVGYFFTKWYNKQHRTDFEVKKDPEDRDLDCIMKSETTNKEIGLQITTYDLKSLEENAKHLKKEERLVINPERIKCINIAINKKNNGISKNFPLLIWSNSLTGINRQYLEKETKITCDKSNFKEIYIIRLPSNPTDTGDIIQIK